ncbi:MAG: photosystem II stability/assembly factor-like uncharacterized protein [Flavobacteriales bacterium]|jgi:photosystem II stability/assembly factor-like uncharacterized protein
MFKYKNLLILSLFILLITAYFNKKSQKTESLSGLLEQKMIPSDHLFFQRSFPYNTLDVKAIDKLKTTVKNSISSNKSFNTTPWAQEGPTNIGGRINCVAVHPLNEDIILSGTSAGGIYKTANGGISWAPIGDEMAELSTSSIVFDPSNPEIIYVGTGDHNISGTVNAGGGIYKSTNGGDSWSYLGLINQRIVSRIVLNPDNTQEIYAATMGLPFERNTDRGLYKSTDGGVIWEQILLVSDEAGIIDLVMNPTNPSQLFASSWNRIRNNSESMVSGTDGHVFRSNDSGLNWEIIDDGLPMEFGDPVSRIGLAVSHENPGKVFCVVVGSFLDIQGVYSLEPNANEWNDLNSFDLEGSLGGFGWYFGQIRVNPTNDNEISILGVDLWTTTNGGNSWNQSAPPWFTYEVHADKHDMTYLDSGEILLATDGGLYKGELFEDWEDIDEIPNSQFYRVAVNPFSDLYTGGLQDNGTTSGNENSPSNWSRDRGGDGFQAIFSPDDAGIYYSETQRGNLARNTGGDSWTDFNNGIDENDRRNWDMPFIMSSHSSDVLYTGTYRLYKNTDAYDDNWQAISPTLTGEVITSNSFHTISTIGESRVNENILYTGSTDAQVWRTLDGGDSWSEIDDGLPTRYVTNIKTSDVDEAVVFITHSGYKDNDNVSHIHMSDDFGDTWIDISGDLPELPINHLELIDDEKLIIATDMGVYFSANQGENWERVGNNMPLIPVFDIEIDIENDKLIAGTFARSMMSFPLDSLYSEPVGIQEVLENINITLFPNPTIDILNIKSDQQISNVRIHDLQGKLVLNETMNFSSRSIDLGKLVPGIYNVEVIFLDGSNHQELISKN